MSHSPTHTRSRAPSLTLLTSNFHSSAPSPAAPPATNGRRSPSHDVELDSAPPTPLTAPSTPFNAEAELVRLQDELDSQAAVAHGAANFLAMLDPAVAAGEDGAGASAELKSQVERELAQANENSQQIIGQINRLNSTLIRANSARSAAFSPLVSEYGANDILNSPISPYPITQANSQSSSNGQDASDAFGPSFELVITLLQRLGDVSDASERLRAMDRVVAAVKAHPALKHQLQLDDVLPGIMDGLADTATKQLRAGTYRLLRHLVVDQQDVNLLYSACFDIFLVRSLARDHKFELEKEQAIRLVRMLLGMPDTDQPVSASVIRAIVAIAETGEEKLRLSCLQLLGELVITDIGLLINAEGLRVVLQSLSDGPHDLSPLLALGFLWVMDRPGTRQFLRPGLDIEIALAAFTEVQVKGSSQDERIRASAVILASFVKSWSGFMYLCLNGQRAMASLMDSLRNPAKLVRETLVDLLFDLLRIQPPAWDSRGHPREEDDDDNLRGQRQGGAISEASADGVRTNLIDQYLAVLLLVFLEVGMVETLAAVAAEEKESPTARKVAYLISEVLQLANRVLPPAYATQVQSLPDLFSLSANFDSGGLARVAASSTLIALDNFNRDRSLLVPNKSVPGGAQVEDPLKRGQRQVETSKIQAGMQIDDASFRNLLLQTQVLTTKDYTKWSRPLLLQLVQGPLLNPRRLDEAARASKFMRRVMSFYQPFSYRFSNTLADEDSTQWTELGCTVLQTLLANADGIKYLAEDKLLRQLAEAFAQLEPAAGIHPNELLFSKARMTRTLTLGYFEMIGVLTRSAEGIKLLNQFKLFSAFYRLFDFRARPDLVQALLEHLDYSHDGHTRVLLSKALTASQRQVRIFATEKLHKIMRSTTVESWHLRLLVTQIYDPAPEVCELAVKALEEACRSLDALEMVVQMRPSLDDLGSIGVGLLTRFLSTSIGVRYLDEIGFIAREMDDWFEVRNDEYVVELELSLARELHIGPLHSAKAAANTKAGTPAAVKASFDGIAPSHFYGELVKTEEGCDILDQSEHFAIFVDYIREHGLEDYDSDIIARLKSMLWAVGHIGASPGGLPFLEAEYIVQSIVEIAETSPVYSLRGTAFFVLGLISCTLEGVEILDSLGWQSVCTPLGGTTGLCMPINVANFVDTEPWTVPALPPPESLQLPFPTSSHERSALSALANLSNHILATKASKTLSILRRKHREVFNSPGLYYRALEMLANHHYRLAVRRYIIELFDGIELGSGGAQRVIEAGEELRKRGEEQKEVRKGWTPWKMGGKKAEQSWMNGIGAQQPAGGGTTKGDGSEEDEFDWDEESEEESTDSSEEEEESGASAQEDGAPPLVGVKKGKAGGGGAKEGKKGAQEARVLVPALTVRGFLLS